MKSPFPGMDPYIEACGLWEDFHTHMIEKLYDALSPVLPPGYVARAGNRSYVLLGESQEKKEHTFVPDVSVASERGRRSQPGGSQPAAEAATTTKAEPVLLQAFIEAEFEEKFIDIYELKPERRLVTSIE